MRKFPITWQPIIWPKTALVVLLKKDEDEIAIMRLNLDEMIVQPLGPSHAHARLCS